MKQVGKIVGINLLVMFGYLLAAIVYTRFTSKPGYGAGEYLAFAATGITAHLFVCLAGAIYFYVKRKANTGTSWILSMLAVLLIGFSACLGGANLAYGLEP